MVTWLYGCGGARFQGYHRLFSFLFLFIFIDLVVFVGMLGNQLSRTVGQKLILLYNNISNRTHCKRNKNGGLLKHQKQIYFFSLGTLQP
jgi:hypothetical protein